MRGAEPIHRTLRFSGGQTPQGCWAAVRTEPHPALVDTVRLYQGYSGITPRPVRRRELPVGNVVLILNFGPDYRMVDRDSGRSEARSSFIAGLHRSYVLVDNDRIDRCLHVELSPLGAYRLFRTPMVGFQDRTVEFADVLGPDAEHLLERLYLARDWSSRFAILDSWQLRRLAEAPPPSREIAWAWKRIERRRGAVRIADIAASLDWSRKRLVAGFREEIGIAPKTLGRVLRFHHALETLSGSGCPAAEVAAACGYADQAHMIREFRAISGLTPGAIAETGRPQSDSVIGT